MFLIALPVKADQLSYISKSQAKKAKRAIKKMDYVYLYCGCCNNDPKKLVKIIKTEVKFTNYQNYYQVVLTYIDKDGVTKTEGIDLAYVWINKKNKIQTVGELLNYEHDPCNRLGEVEWH